MPILNMAYGTVDENKNNAYLSVAVIVDKKPSAGRVITATPKNGGNVIKFTTDSNGIATTKLQSGEYTLNCNTYTSSVYVVEDEMTTYTFEFNIFNYGIKIPLNDSNPNCGVYIEDCAGFVNANNANLGSWINDYLLKSIKPCVLRADGTVNYYLDKNNRTKKEDGTPSVLTGEDGDVMVEIPKLYWYMKQDSTHQYIYLSNDKLDNNYQCLAHTKGNVELDKIYVSSYLGFNDNGVLRSVSGKSPTGAKTIGVFRTQAQSRANWQQMDFHTLTLLQILYLIVYKNRDSQTQLGKGYTGYTSSDQKANTGGTNTKPWCFGYTGTNDGKQQNCFLGIEDFYGNYYYFIDGLFSDANRNILTSTNNYNDDGSGYTNNGHSGYTSDTAGFLKNIQGTNSTGFIPKGDLGGTLTYYADYASLSASCLPAFGGCWYDGVTAGAFRLAVYYSASTYLGFLSARCVYKG